MVYIPHEPDIWDKIGIFLTYCGCIIGGIVAIYYGWDVGGVGEVIIYMPIGVIVGAIAGALLGFALIYIWRLLLTALGIGVLVGVWELISLFFNFLCGLGK